MTENQSQNFVLLLYEYDRRKENKNIENRETELGLGRKAIAGNIFKVVKRPPPQVWQTTTERNNGKKTKRLPNEKISNQCSCGISNIKSDQISRKPNFGQKILLKSEEFLPYLYPWMALVYTVVEQKFKDDTRKVGDWNACSGTLITNR